MSLLLFTMSLLFGPMCSVLILWSYILQVSLWPTGWYLEETVRRWPLVSPELQMGCVSIFQRCRGVSGAAIIFIYLKLLEYLLKLSDLSQTRRHSLMG